MTSQTDLPAGVVNVDDLDPLPWSTVYELLRFRHDNTYGFLREKLSDPDPNTPVEVTHDDLRTLIRFAASQIGNGDPTVPRILEAHRVVSLVPEEYGAALFGVPARP